MAYIQIDIQEELEPYIDRFNMLQYKGNKIQCCSPFRHESNPSFAINLDTGTWVDSGAIDNNLQRGNFIKLLAFLQGVSYEEALDYIKYKYSRIFSDASKLELHLENKLVNPFYKKEESIVPDVTKYTGYTIRAKYLLGRGIDWLTQREVGTFETSNAIGIPVKDISGNIVAYKMRSTTCRKFWYTNDIDIKQYMFGLSEALQDPTSPLYVVEGEIDAITIQSMGYNAVATYGASISDYQLRQLKKFKHVIIATDNDAVGHAFRQTLAEKLVWTVPKLEYIVYPIGIKDINQVLQERKIGGVERCLQNTRTVTNSIDIGLEL